MNACLVVALLAGLALGSQHQTLSEFQDIFSAFLHRNNPGVPEATLLERLLYPAPSLVQAHAYSDISAVDAAFADVKPSECTRPASAANGAPGAAVDPLAPLLARRAAGRAPVTIVSLNGMAGEFVPHAALSAAYNKSSSFALAFRQMLRSHPHLTDTVFDNKRLADVEVPLGELVMAGSMDAADGTPLYQIVLLVQRENSLESLRHYSVVVPRIVSRISKFLSLAGPRVEDFVLVGFSRGSIDALQIASMHESLPWGDRIRGVITLDGVVHGSAFADCAYLESSRNPGGMCDSLSRGMAWIELLSTGLVPSLTHVIQNTALITRASAEVGLALADIRIPQQLLRSRLVFPDAIKSWNQLVKNILFEFDVMHPISGYGDNIRKLRNLAGAFADCVRMLTTQGRAEWWRSHTLPADRLYASSTGTLRDRSHSDAVVHPDEYAMRELYYLTSDASGQELVDGPVQSARQLVLPGVHRALNAAQAPYEAHWLGLFHTTHAGATLDYAFPCPDGWVDPFPRKSLVDSFASWVAAHSQ
eukprot:m51a1_g12265 hypothetical protein (533) ;mRNA; f:196004-198015